MNTPPFVVEEWTAEHPRWQELVEAVALLGQTHWAFNPFFERFPRHFLVASQGEGVVGFLMFVVWEIGPHDRNAPTLQIQGIPLTEAKIIAFGVREGHRRRGIGRALQGIAIDHAKGLGCYQVRSVSGSDHPENYQLKLSMGFAVEPMERETPGVAFLMPLT